MNGICDLGIWWATVKRRGLALCGVLGVLWIACFEPAHAQAPPIPQSPPQVLVPTTQAVVPAALAPIAGLSTSVASEPLIAEAPTAPPLISPEVGQLPTGPGILSAGPWLLSPSVSLYTLYDSNIYSSPTAPQSGPGLHVHASVLADLDTGIYKTSLYGSFDSAIYPTLNSSNDTLNAQAGIIESYSPLRDLVFTAHGDYTHSANAYVITNSLPNPIFSPGSPPPAGAAGVVAAQETELNPNDTFTGTGTVYKELNRGFVSLSGSVARTNYEGISFSTPGQSFLPDYNRESYYGNGGIWLTPLFYAYTDGLQAYTSPDVGSASSASRARGGIGTAPIGLFRGSVYAGWQGADVFGGGTAGGEIYGGLISFLPTPFLNVDLSVDRLANISNIMTIAPQAQSIGGLPLAAIGVPLNESVQITSTSLKSNYVLSPQTSIFCVLNNSRIEFIGSSRVDNSWLASLGVQHRLTSNVLLTLDYQYTAYVSAVPFTSFTRNLASVGAVYTF